MVLELSAQPAFAQSAEAYDPWEGMNRKFFAVQDVLDRHIFGPLARGFGETPKGFRARLVDFARNISEPLVFVNDVLQAHPKAAATTFARFAMNSTVGLLGLFDPASHNHLPHHDNSFGTTLGRWGAQPGPYLFLPVVGPGDLRDAIGAIGNMFLNPFYYSQFPGKTEINLSTGAINGLNTRLEAEAALSNIQATSTDPYATLRSYFWQNRQAEIKGNPAEPEALPDFDMPDESTGASPSTTPQGSVAPPGAPPAISQPPGGISGVPLSGFAGAIARPTAVPDRKAAPPATNPAPQTAPPSDAAPPAGSPQAGSPKWLVAPDDDDGPLRTAGGK